MKTYAEINAKIESGQAVVLTADEVMDYVDRKGLASAAAEIDVVTTATFGPMCSSGCFLNFGHSKPRIRITEAWIEDVLVYSGVAAVDVYLGATQLRHGDSANMYYPGEFRYGGGHVIEDLVAGKTLQLFALSYGTDEYPLREMRTYFSLKDLNQATMVNPRNCYQNYNVAINDSDRRLHTYMGFLEPRRGNANYCSAGQLSPLLNDPLYETIGVGTRVWLAGAHGHVYSEGTQHSAVCQRGENDVPMEGSGTLALTADMKQMRPEFVRGVSLIGYGVSLALGVGIPIPILNEQVLRRAPCAFTARYKATRAAPAGFCATSATSNSGAAKSRSRARRCRWAPCPPTTRRLRWRTCWRTRSARGSSFCPNRSAACRRTAA